MAYLRVDEYASPLSVNLKQMSETVSELWFRVIGIVLHSELTLGPIGSGVFRDGEVDLAMHYGLGGAPCRGVRGSCSFVCRGIERGVSSEGYLTRGGCSHAGDVCVCAVRVAECMSWRVCVCAFRSLFCSRSFFGL